MTPWIVRCPSKTDQRGERSSHQAPWQFQGRKEACLFFSEVLLHYRLHPWKALNLEAEGLNLKMASDFIVLLSKNQKCLFCITIMVNEFYPQTRYKRVTSVKQKQCDRTELLSKCSGSVRRLP